jgi:hypothetical protein
MEKITLTRKQLYDLIWSEPISSIAKKYKTSFAELRMICVHMNIPIPKNGHWSKIRYGKQVEVILGGNSAIEENQELSEINNSKIIEAVEGIQDLSFIVPERLVKPDELIINTKNYYDAVRRYDWRSGASYPSHHSVLNINVSQNSLSRALRIMDTIIKLLKSKNHNVIIKYDKTYAIIEGEEIEIRLKEKNRVSEVKDQYGRRQLESTGKIGFIIGDFYKKEVNDGIDLIETKLPIILAKLEAEGHREHEERIEREKRQKEREETLRIENEIHERKEKESHAFKEFFSNATRLHQANILRNYIRTIEANAIKNGSISDEINNWINWAKQKVDWYDPLINKEDLLLDGNYKIQLFKEFLKEWQ